MRKLEKLLEADAPNLTGFVLAYKKLSKYLSDISHVMQQVERGSPVDRSVLAAASEHISDMAAALKKSI